MEQQVPRWSFQGFCTNICNYRSQLLVSVSRMAANISFDIDPGSCLARSHLIGELTAESLEQLGSLAQTIELGEGEVLFFQDDIGDAIYIVEAGSIEISIKINKTVP